ncbi:hypothetical protein BH09ACT6_BH09ACT6_20300 [soil metagenome]
MKKVLLVVISAVVVAGGLVALTVGLAGQAASSPVSGQETAVAGASGGTAVTPASTTPSTGSQPGSGVTPATAAGGPAQGGSPRPGQGAGDGLPRFDSVSITPSVTCAVPSEARNAPQPESPSVTLSWQSSGATSAFVGVDTTDAQAEPYAPVDASGTAVIPFPCPRDEQTYTITIVNRNGSQSNTVTVVNQGYRGR